jgi:Domain of unknown function (DUF4395)
MTSETPKPIDPRGPRTNQAVLSLALIAGFVADWRPVVPLFAVVLLVGAAFGPRYGPVLRIYAQVIGPRLRPAAELEDPRPPRFAAAVGVAFLVAAAGAFTLGWPGAGWALALVVAGLAGLAAVTGICIGCEVYLWLAGARAFTTAPRPGARFPGWVTAGAERTWAVFTTPYCASCGSVVAHLHAADPGARVVEIDATEHPGLARAFAVHRAPTIIESDGRGYPGRRLVGPEAVREVISA